MAELDCLHSLAVTSSSLGGMNFLAVSEFVYSNHQYLRAHVPS